METKSISQLQFKYFKSKTQQWLNRLITHKFKYCSDMKYFFRIRNTKDLIVNTSTEIWTMWITRSLNENRVTVIEGKI